MRWWLIEPVEFRLSSLWFRGASQNIGSLDACLSAFYNSSSESQDLVVLTSTCVHIYIYIYIYTYNVGYFKSSSPSHHLQEADFPMAKGRLENSSRVSAIGGALNALKFQ